MDHGAFVQRPSRIRLMRIAQVICAADFAGAESVGCGLARALDSVVEHSAIYVVQEVRAGKEGCDRLVERARGFNTPMEVFKSTRRADYSLLQAIARRVSEDRIDLLHAHSYKVATMTALLRLRGALEKSVFTVHGFDRSTVRGRLFLQSVNLLGVASCDAVVAVNQKIGNVYRAWPFLRNRLHVIGNAVPEVVPRDAALRQQARNELSDLFGLDRSKRWIVSVGRLVPVKNHELLLEAASRLVEAGSRFEWLIVGDGPERKRIQELADRIAPASVHLLGTQDRMAHIYRAADLLLLTSHSEGSPMVVLEAMGYGIPVVASAVGDIPQLIGECAGATFSPGNATELCSRIQEVSDPEQLKRFSIGAYDRARNDLGAARWAERHASLYSKLLGSRSRGNA